MELYPQIPFEIVDILFQPCDILTLFKCRRVSKIWKDLIDRRPSLFHWKWYKLGKYLYEKTHPKLIDNSRLIDYHHLYGNYLYTDADGNKFYDLVLRT